MHVSELYTCISNAFTTQIFTAAIQPEPRKHTHVSLLFIWLIMRTKKCFPIILYAMLIA